MNNIKNKTPIIEKKTSRYNNVFLSDRRLYNDKVDSINKLKEVKRNVDLIEQSVLSTQKGNNNFIALQFSIVTD